MQQFLSIFYFFISKEFNYLKKILKINRYPAYTNNIVIPSQIIIIISKDSGIIKEEIMGQVMVDHLLNETLENYSFYNITNMPFDYVAFIKKEEILSQAHKILNTDNEEKKEQEKYILLRLIYTNLYKLNLEKTKAKKYFEEAIFTEKFKSYLGVAFKFTILYNPDDDSITTTFIHLAQLVISDIVYEYLWKLENKESH
ncbi:MAG: hypothetical protein DKM50_09725 [Candidatus Margulisiibacteriota bacterium]|nr:MAG: hypothetical protein DKM50_09725 [Candidatus Margulisiibacteriota bacterium]